MARRLLFFGMTRPLPWSLLAAGLLAGSLLTIPLLPSAIRIHAGIGEVANVDTASDDQDIAAAVMTALRRDLRTTDASRVAARAHGGVVTLTGWVSNEAQRDRAEKIAYGVAAVERVVDEIRVVAPPPNPRGM